jgi:two-component system LytT family response regulator
MTEIKTLIIDDEFSNRNLVKSLVIKLEPEYRFVGEASSAEQGFHLIKELQPNLVLLDIKMPGENGFDLLKRFDPPPFEVVFITGFDEYAMQAFECHALDYILKPIDQNKFEKAMGKVRQRLGNSLSNLDNLKRILGSYQSDEAMITRIPVHHKSTVVLLDMNELAYIKSDNGCTIFMTLRNEEYISAKKLAEYSFIIQRFPHFIHINRGTYINLNSIKSYSKGVDCFITLKNDEVFEISRRKKAEILAVLHRN